jgi:hypothetical protein
VASGSARRRPSRKQAVMGRTGMNQQDGIIWPGLRANHQGRSEVEINAAAQRAEQLLTGGWAAVTWVDLLGEK